ncbi:MAG: phage baseplate protein [Cellulosilyticaceae bacterium]
MLTNQTTGEILTFSLIAQEDMTHEADVTSEPTEAGYEISDGMLTRNATLSVKGKNGVLQLSNLSSEINGVAEAISILAKWQREAHLLHYAYRNGFANCVLKKFKIRQTPKERYGYEFELELEQIRIVRAATTKVTGKTKPDGIIAKQIAEKEKKSSGGGKRTTTGSKKAKEPLLTNDQKKAIKNTQVTEYGGYTPPSAI